MCQVKFVVDESELSHVDGAGDVTLSDALEKLFSQVCRHTAYEPVCDALPLGFVQSASKTAQVNSLKYHAEKKALATLLLRSAPDLKMRVNIKVCADCQCFLKNAAQYLGRPIEVLEASRKHVFRGDAYACGEGSGGVE